MPNDSTESLSATTPSVPVPANAQEAARSNIIREIVETERKYVQDLEVMQTYAQALSQSSTIDQDTIHLLFPNLNKLLNFQRKFLIRVEGTAELPWLEQRWGILFTENEEEFAVYEPYCANYTNASELMLMEEQNLQKFNHVINAKSELPAFLIKPVQRICKYPLLLDSLIKATNPEYPYIDELKSGSAAAKRIADTINEAQRRAENQQTVQNLASRVDDWKGHHVSSFGELLLDNIFIVTKSEVDREYHVFLFERIILCCKEDPGAGKEKKVGKSNSILKKPGSGGAGTVGGQTAPGAAASAGGAGKRKTTPLLLKGRIYLNNVTDAKAIINNGTYSLNVWWKGDDDLEYFTLRCRNEEQVRLWETSIKRLIERLATRRATERTGSRMAFQAGNSTNPAALRMPPPPNPSSNNPNINGNGNANGYQHQQHMSMGSGSAIVVPSLQQHPYGNSAARAYSRQSNQPSAGGPQGYPYPDEHPGSMFSPAIGGPQGYPPHDGFDVDGDGEDEYEDYPAVVMPGSGRATPADGRRGTMPSVPGGSSVIGEGGMGGERTRAYTEDANGAVMSQWRSNHANHHMSHNPHPHPHHPQHPHHTQSHRSTPHGSPNLSPLGPNGSGLPMSQRPNNPRLNSAMSAASFASNSSFGNAPPHAMDARQLSNNGPSPIPGSQPRPALRSQFSSSRLRSTYESGSENGSPQISSLPMPGMGMPPPPVPPLSASQGLPNPHAPQMNGNGNAGAAPLRTRSASQPSAYVPRAPAGAPPPLPTNGWKVGSVGNGNGVNGVGGEKRSSGSSHSSSGGEGKSEYSPNSSTSPITPFGSNDSVGVGVGYASSTASSARTSHTTMTSIASKAPPPSSNTNGVPAGLVKVKVHFGVYIFVIQVPRTTEFAELMEKVGRKIRLCGGRGEEAGPLRVKYEDEEGDMISMRSTEDVDMAFGGKTQVVLHVQ